MWRCAHLGQLCTIFSGKKLGIAKEHTSKAVARIDSVFQREK
jgi:hypothetical protein